MSANDPDLKEFMAYGRTFFIPLIVSKTFVMYFGLNYSMYPGEGYGYGLAGAITFTVCNMAYFIYSQSKRNSTEPKD